jgi:hypothetical protein
MQHQKIVVCLAGVRWFATRASFYFRQGPAVGLLAMALLSQPAQAQKSPKPAVNKPAATASTLVTDPLLARFEIRDVANFWRAFDADAAATSPNPFLTLYWQPASAGTRVLLEKNGLPNADSLRAVVRRRRADYQRIRAASERVAEVVPAYRATYLALKNLYPASTFPPVFFGVGSFNVGGNAHETGLLVGVEKSAPADLVPVVAHELVHAQQHIPYKYRILLEQCIIEGSADFLGEMISGHPATPDVYAYARSRERELWHEFERDQNLGENDSFANWLYGGERPAGRPADLGYYIGYQITKAYYDRAADKRQAIHDILNIADCRLFLQQSGYASRFN